eukprot:scaffold260999_cov26-Tisochrysis_lutea.AAC.1
MGRRPGTELCEPQRMQQQQQQLKLAYNQEQIHAGRMLVGRPVEKNSLCKPKGRMHEGEVP